MDLKSGTKHLDAPGRNWIRLGTILVQKQSSLSSNLQH